MSKKQCLLLLLITLLACFAAYRPSPITLDSSIFLSMAYHLKNGRLLYAEIWDNKPPVTYFSYYLAYSIFPDIRVVHLLRLFGFAAIAFALTLVLLSKNDDIKLVVLTMVPSLLLLHGLNEQTCSADLLGQFWFAAFLATALYFKSWPIASFFAALTVLCKEPYCLVILPWLIQGFWALAESLDGEQLKSRRLKMVFAFLLPNLIFLSYLLLTGTFDDYLYTLGVNFAFSQRVAGQSLLSFFIFGSTIGKRLLIPLLTFLVYRVILDEDKSTIEDKVLLFGLITSSLAVSMAKRDFLNYSIMAFAPIVLAFRALIGRALAHLGKKEWSLRKVLYSLYFAYFAIFFIFLGIILWQQQAAAVRNMGWDYWNHYQKNPLYSYLAKEAEPGDGLWIPYGGVYWLYPALDQESPSAMHFYFTSVHGRPNASSRKKLLSYFAEVRAKPPRFIVDGAAAEKAVLMLEPVMRSWLLSNYKKVLKKESNGDLLVLWEHQ